MLNRNKCICLAGIISTSLLAACSPDSNTEVNTADSTPAPEVIAAPVEKAVAPDSNPLRNAYFGETHMHTAYSLDAYIGGTRLSPSDAYRFARGATVTVDGKPYSRKRPLDFVAVTDHAEYIGEMYSTMVEGAPGHDQELLEELRNLQTTEEKLQWFMTYVIKSNRGKTPKHPPFYAGKETTKSAWQVMIDSAEEHNDPGNFTAFVAYEWSAAPGGGNLHRNIIYRDAHVPDIPMSYIDINREDDLWAGWVIKRLRA